MLFIFIKYIPVGLVGKYNNTPSVASVLAGPIINLVLLTKTSTRLINIAIDAFNTFFTIGKVKHCILKQEIIVSNFLLGNRLIFMIFENIRYTIRTFCTTGDGHHLGNNGYSFHKIHSKRAFKINEKYKYLKFK